MGGMKGCVMLDENWVGLNSLLQSLEETGHTTETKEFDWGTTIGVLFTKNDRRTAIICAIDEAGRLNALSHGLTAWMLPLSNVKIDELCRRL